MRVTSITYSRGTDFSHENISVTLEVEPNETAQETLIRAKKFVLHNLERGPDPELNKARAILENPEENIGRDVQWAKAYIAALPPVNNEPIL